jgi:hypothetical protein
MTKNDFALKVMETLNEELLQYEHSSPVITVGDYDKDGNQIFIDCDDEKFPIDQLFQWLNVLVNDQEYLDDNMITPKMILIYEEAKMFGHITDKTPKYW